MADNTVKIKRAVISYENMSQDLVDAFKEKYPHGYADYLSDIIKVDKPDGSHFYAVSLEVPGAIYLVKIKVKEDNIEDIQDDFFKDGSDDDDSQGGDSQDGEIPMNDDDIAGDRGDDPDTDSDSE